MDDEAYGYTLFHSGAPVHNTYNADFRLKRAKHHNRNMRFGLGFYGANGALADYHVKGAGVCSCSLCAGGKQQQNTF